MTIKKIICVLVLFSGLQTFAQKELLSSYIKGLNVTISAEAENINRVKIKFLNTTESNKVIDSVLITPFNEYNFKIQIKQLLKKTFEKDTLNEKKLFENEFHTKIKNWIENEVIKDIDDKISYLFKIFESQLILIFKYDNQPIAGNLYFNKNKIKAQRYDVFTSENYIINTVRDYHKLIKEYHKKSVDKISYCEKENDEIPDSAIYENFLKEKDRNGFQYFNDDNGKQFKCYFKDIILNFRNLNHTKRNELIHDLTLKKINKEVFKKLNTDLKKIDSIKDEISILENAIKSIDNYKTAEDQKKEIESEILKKETAIEINKNIINSLENDIEDLKKASESNKISIKELSKDLNKEVDSLNIKDSLKELKSNLTKVTSAITYKSSIKKKQRDLKDENKLDLEKLKSDLEKKEAIIKNDPTSNKQNLDSLTVALKILNEKLKTLELTLQTKLKEEAPLWSFEPERIQLDINDGFLEHIVVFGSMKFSDDFDYIIDIKKRAPLKELSENLAHKKIKFTSKFPIGFSSEKDYDDLKSYKLYSYKGKHKEYELKLSDIITNYEQILKNDRLSYSPKDMDTIIYPQTESKNYIELKKAKTSKLLNLGIYSDFIGLSSNEPNGVLQFDFKKQIPLYTKRYTSRLGERYINRGYNYGYLNYVTPKLRWSRLNNSDDENNLTLKYLKVFEGMDSNDIPYVTKLDLLRYENISVGADLNLISIDLPTSKMKLEINGGVRYARVKVNDTKGKPLLTVSDIEDRYNINTWRLYPEFILRLRPEERYGANLLFRTIRFNSVTNDFLNINSEKSFVKNFNDQTKWLNQIEINAHFSPSGSKDDRFFFKYRYTNNSKWEYNGYGEFLVGYSMSLKF